MMRKILTILLSVLFALQLSAQITEQKSFLTAGPGETIVTITVKEKKTNLPMIGASVFLSCKGDTLKTVTDDKGLAYFNDIPYELEKDTLHVNLSFMGYRSLEYKYLHKPFIRLQALMEEDPEQLSEIIVRADAVAMVVRGDTTIFNANAFVSMDGDNLASLLQKLPGISMNGGQLLANGKPVSKILLNGSAMFNTNLAAAMDLVKSEEVKNVKIYDQYDQNRLMEADTLKGRERVVDVVTKKPINVKQRAELLATAGIYKDKNKKKNHDLIGELGGNYSRYGVNLPSYSVGARVYHNSNQTLPTTSPMDGANLSLNTSRNKPFKSNYNHSIYFNWNRAKKENFSNESYQQTDTFEQKEIERDNRIEDHKISLNYNGNMGWALGKKNSIQTRISLNYSRDGSNHLSQTSNMTDGSTFLSDIRKKGQTDHYMATVGVGYKHNFEKKGREMDCNLDGSFSKDDGAHHRTDTSETSAIPQWLKETKTGENFLLNFSAGYAEPFSKLVSMNLKYYLKGNISNRKRLSYDRLLDQIDTLNTYNYRHRDISNQFHIGLRFRNVKGNFNANASLQYDISSQMRKDLFPENPDYPRVYQHLSPYLRLTYYSTILNMDMTYSEIQIIPSIDDTRMCLDNSSPFFLRAGNPSLKQAIRRNANMHLTVTLPKTASTLKLMLLYSQTQNATAYDKTYFKEDTYLPEYDYTAPTGSQLARPVNIRGNRSLMADLSWSMYITRINTSIMLGPQYDWKEAPYIVNDGLHVTGTHSVALDIRLVTNLSTFAEISLGSKTSYGINQIDRKLLFRSLNEDLDAQLKVNLFKRLWLKSNIIWNWMGTDNKQAQGYHGELWNAGLSWKFGQKKNVELGFDVHDILNRNNSWSTVILEDYIQSSWSTLYGTSFLLTLRWEF